MPAAAGRGRPALTAAGPPRQTGSAATGRPASDGSAQTAGSEWSPLSAAWAACRDTGRGEGGQHRWRRETNLGTVKYCYTLRFMRGGMEGIFD